MNNDTAPSVRDLERRALPIHPGEWAIEQQRPLATLLGSCVTVCLHDPVLRIGGINHFMLPNRSNRSNSTFDEILSGDYAMEVLVNALFSKGAQRKRLQAKAFGGGNMLPALNLSIGDRNANFACEWLEREGIPLMASDLGGPWARKIIFTPHNGEVFCRRIKNGESLALEAANEQANYEKQQKSNISSGQKKIELF